MKTPCATSCARCGSPADSERGGMDEVQMAMDEFAESRFAAVCGVGAQQL